MPVHIKSTSNWKCTDYSICLSLNWNIGYQLCIYGSGSYRPTKKYNWVIGSYGTCSKTCGGGTQTRSVICNDELEYTKSDAHCIKYVGTKPDTSQACNTQGCSTTLPAPANHYLLTIKRNFSSQREFCSGAENPTHYGVINNTQVWTNPNHLTAPVSFTYSGCTYTQGSLYATAEVGGNWGEDCIDYFYYYLIKNC